jgi:hypothetical protein
MSFLDRNLAAQDYFYVYVIKRLARSKPSVFLAAKERNFKNSRYGLFTLMFPKRVLKMGPRLINAIGRRRQSSAALFILHSYGMAITKNLTCEFCQFREWKGW